MSTEPLPHAVYTLDEVIAMTRSSYHQVARWRAAGLLRPIANTGRAVRFTGRAVIDLLDAIDPHAATTTRPPLRLAT